MMELRQFLFGFAALGLAACGTHSNPAPASYGAKMQSKSQAQPRIYNSRNEIYRKQQEELEQRRQAALAARQYQQPATVQPVTLTPVSAVYLDEPAPVPIADAQKVKGYIEVQPGDTVYALARRFNVPPKSIIEANDLRAPYALSVGQAIKLPSGATLVSAPAAQTRTVQARDTLYAVRPGDTLYSISRASKIPVSAIAQANKLRQPYTLSVGQQLLIPQAPVTSAIYANAPQQRQAASPAKIANTTTAPRNVGDIARNVSYAQPTPSKTNSLFAWPVRGAVIADYGSGEVGRRNDGVNIAAPAGTPVRAAADGEVVYRGSELDGFGNLLLVKHANGYVTAYAHNDAMLVKKGDRVRQGQMIAKVGETGSVTSPQLHFEVRQNLKSINPVALLGPQ